MSSPVARVECHDAVPALGGDRSRKDAHASNVFNGRRSNGGQSREDVHYFQVGRVWRMDKRCLPGRVNSEKVWPSAGWRGGQAAVMPVTFALIPRGTVHVHTVPCTPSIKPNTVMPTLIPAPKYMAEQRVLAMPLYRGSR